MRQRYLLTVVVTILFGIVPFAALSLATGTLLPSDAHQFPLLAIPSIWLGDLLLLPIFNAEAVLLASASRNWDLRPSRFLTLWLLGLGGLTSGLIHYAWVSDEDTGFMDTAAGELTLAGWWHVAFSAVEYALVFALFVGWLRAVRLSRERLAEFTPAWLALSCFLSIPLVEAVLRSTLTGDDFEIVPLVQPTAFLASAVACFLISALARADGFERADHRLR